MTFILKCLVLSLGFKVINVENLHLQNLERKFNIFQLITSVIAEFPTSNFIFVTFYLCKKRLNYMSCICSFYSPLSLLNYVLFVPTCLTCLWSRTYVPLCLALLRALRAYAPSVPKCLRALRYYVPTCLRALRYYVPTCLALLRALRAYTSYLPTCLCALRYDVPTCLALLRTYVPTCLCAWNYYVPTCFRASNYYYVPTCLRALNYHVPLFLRAYVLTCLYVFFKPTCLRAINYFVPTCAHFSRAYVKISHKIYWGSLLYFVFLFLSGLCWRFIPLKIPKQTPVSKAAYHNPILWGFVISNGACPERIIWGLI